MKFKKQKSRLDTIEAFAFSSACIYPNCACTSCTCATPSPPETPQYGGFHSTGANRKNNVSTSVVSRN